MLDNRRRVYDRRDSIRCQDFLLASEDPGAGLPVFASRDRDSAAEQVMHEPPGAILAPRPKVMVDHPPRGQVMGQQAPRAAAAPEREDGVQALTLRVRFRSASGLGFGNQMLDQGPFFVTEIGRIGWWWVHARDHTRSRSAVENFLDTLLANREMSCGVLSRNGRPLVACQFGQ
jgi:hypothetical protein